LPAHHCAKGTLDDLGGRANIAAKKEESGVNG
jgi:hypothetical protein